MLNTMTNVVERYLKNYPIFAKFGVLYKANLI